MFKVGDIVVILDKHKYFFYGTNDIINYADTIIELDTKSILNIRLANNGWAREEWLTKATKLHKAM